MAWMIEVEANDWAGATQRGWRPAIAGRLNTTGYSDEEASTFETEEAAREVAEKLVVPERPDNWRIVEVDDAKLAPVVAWPPRVDPPEGWVWAAAGPYMVRLRDRARVLVRDAPEMLAAPSAAVLDTAVELWRMERGAKDEDEVAAVDPDAPATVDVVITERGNGFPPIGAYVLDHESSTLYRVVSYDGPIHTDQPGRPNYSYGTAEEVSLDVCEEGDEYPAGICLASEWDDADAGDADES